MISLQPYAGPSTRYQCPQCRDRQKTFSRYIDTDTGLQLADHVGKCARLVKCGYHYGPKEYFKDNPTHAGVGVITNPRHAGQSRPQLHSAHRGQVGDNTNLGVKDCGGRMSNFGLHNPKWDIRHPKFEAPNPKFEIPNPQSNPSFIPCDVFLTSLNHSAPNNFITYLHNTFGDSRTRLAVQRYLVGTSSHRFYHSDHPQYRSPEGATIFWQGDIDQRVRTGKVMLYDAATGKRVKHPFNHITWAHRISNFGSGMSDCTIPVRTDVQPGGRHPTSEIRNQEFNLRQCLFGEHLLYITPHTTTIAIVESEKTAIIASMYMPQFVWLAVGSLSNLTAQRCAVLQGWPVMLFPDLGCYDAWCLKANGLQHIAAMEVSDFLECHATDAQRQSGLDIADYLAGQARHCGQ